MERTPTAAYIRGRGQRPTTAVANPGKTYSGKARKRLTPEAVAKTCRAASAEISTFPNVNEGIAAAQATIDQISNVPLRNQVQSTVGKELQTLQQEMRKTAAAATYLRPVTDDEPVEAREKVKLAAKKVLEKAPQHRKKIEKLRRDIDKTIFANRYLLPVSATQLAQEIAEVEYSIAHHSPASTTLAQELQNLHVSAGDAQRFEQMVEPIAKTQRQTYQDMQTWLADIHAVPDRQEALRRLITEQHPLTEAYNQANTAYHEQMKVAKEQILSNKLSDIRDSYYRLVRTSTAHDKLLAAADRAFVQANEYDRFRIPTDEYDVPVSASALEQIAFYWQHLDSARDVIDRVHQQVVRQQLVVGNQEVDTLANTLAPRQRGK